MGVTIRHELEASLIVFFHALSCWSARLKTIITRVKIGARVQEQDIEGCTHDAKDHSTFMEATKENELSRLLPMQRPF